MWPNPQETVDLVTFSEEIRNEKLHFLYSVCMVFGVNIKQGKIIHCKHFYRSNIIVHHAGLTRSYISTLQEGNTVDFSNNDKLRVSVQQNAIRLRPLSASANVLPTIQQALDKVFDRRDLSVTTWMLDGTESEVTIKVIRNNFFVEIMSC